MMKPKPLQFLWCSNLVPSNGTGYRGQEMCLDKPPEVVSLVLGFVDQMGTGQNLRLMGPQMLVYV